MNDNTPSSIETNKLPPDPEGMNERRTAWASLSLAAFVAATGTDWEDALGDLLTNLMHWADRNNNDFDLALDRARGHYDAETCSGSSWEAYESYLNDPANRPLDMSDADWNVYCPSFDEWKRGRVA